MAKRKKKNNRQEKIIRKIAQQSNVDEQIKRILQLLEVNNEDEARVTDDTLEKYYDYLENELKTPCRLTGADSMGFFSWEEYYIFGLGDQKKYENLRKKYPSYKELIELSSIDPDYGIMVEVQSVSKKKVTAFPFIRIDRQQTYIIPLEDLKPVDKNSRNAQLIDDYGVWFTNYRY